MGTFGELTLFNDVDANFKCYTVERPWLNNQSMISCVPSGIYILEKHASKKYSDTFALVGGTVSHFTEEGKARSCCLIHSANHYESVNGCIGLGESLGFVQGNWAVLNSGKTVKELLSILNGADEQHTLSVVWQGYASE